MSLKPFMIVLLAMFLGVLLIESSQNLVLAQNEPDLNVTDNDSSESLSAKTEKQLVELLSQIDKIISRVEKYKKRIENSSPEDRTVLKMQIYKLRKQLLDDVQQTADTLQDLEKTRKHPELRSEIEHIFSRIIPQLWSHINYICNEIDSLRAKRSKAEATDRAALENEITKLTEHLDVYFEKSFSHIEKMKQIGMDINNAQEAFTRLLYERIDELSGRFELALLRFDEFEAQCKEVPDDADIVKYLNAAKKCLDTNKKSMNVILGLMESLELDTGIYRTQLLAETRDISAGSLDTDVVFHLFKQSYKNTVEWMVKTGPGYLVKLFIFIIILFIFLFIARIVRAGLDKSLDANNLNLSTLSKRMIVSTSSKLIILFGILVALSQWGISLGPLLAGLGIAGFIVGFALQDTLGNFASGIMILLYRPYDVDDIIDVGGIFGIVEKMSLVSTSLLTFDNQLFVVPNSKIWGDVIKNVTAQEFRRIDMVFSISYSNNIPKAESILKDILESHELVLDSPEPVVHLHTLGESSVDFVVRPWVKVNDYWEVYWDITRAVKLRFDEEGISIPFPQRDVHIYNHNPIAQDNI